MCVCVCVCVCVCARARTSTDHELNEALGEVLTPKIPAGTQALLMPDGKAQALLHVLGTRACVYMCAGYTCMCKYVWVHVLYARMHGMSSLFRSYVWM